MAEEMVKTDLLIVGAGPAGAALACFLASHGLRGIMISAAPGNAETPRAHITNMSALECLRDIGLEEACTAAAAAGHNMTHTRWCHSMAGEEYARIYSWGNDPKRHGDYDAASPCRHVDLPQTELEPILTRRAVHKGWTLRFNTAFLGFSRPEADVIISEVRDDVSQRSYKIQSRFLFGCDGARSQVMRQVGIPLIKKPGQGLALNVLLKADMSHLVTNRTGNLHWVFLPEKEHPPWGWACIVRMVRPWSEWMFIFLPTPGADVKADDMLASHEEYLGRIREMIGDPAVRVEILDVSKWWINETVAERYSDGNVFCLGDAVHRHPPFNGLGSNTCIQDAYNLAWKISYVMSGRAGARLLDSFSAERQPVGVDVVTRANQGLRDHTPWLKAIGMLEPDVEVRKQILAEFEDPGEAGRRRREAFQRGVEHTATEFHGVGIEMNQRYFSDAVYAADEAEPMPPLPQDAVREHQITTYPGRRLPHAWLNTRTPGKQFSTHDLAGHGVFCLLTGPGGQRWKEAAQAASAAVGVEIRSYSIGWKQDYEDVYFDWARRREVDEDGCVLARPDRFVAWRSKAMIADPASKLETIPTTRTHLKFTEWAKQYGGIFSLKVGPGTSIVITSPRLIRELIDKKSSIYSHRPVSYVGNGIISGGDHLLIMQYSDRWRTCRKLVHQYFMEQMVVKEHVKVVDAEAVQMARDFLAEPEGHMKHPKRFSNSIIMSLIYGTRTPDCETRHMVKLYHLMENWSTVMEPGNTPPVDIFPFLKYLPESLLGMWRSRAQDVGREMNALYSEWVEHVVTRRRLSGRRDTFLDRVLDNEEKNGIDRHGLYFLCGTLMEGGSDTTSSIVIAFIHAMTKWPEVQKKAQAEIDGVCGPGRTPTWDDYARLPYVAATVKEAMRWRPVVPLAFPHSLAEDDHVDGYLLPKGSDVFINAYGMHHDEERFPNPEVFDPDHYKGVTALASELANGDWANRDHYGYGSGRRLCPGIHLAERNLFLAIAKMLWGFNISPGRDEKGDVIEPDVSCEKAYSAGFLVCAEPFPCIIKPRSDERRQTILREFEKAKTEVFSRFETPKN
ncbi:phenol 2-monooxygenase [Diplogelasinospora grovesii]|uniref:Phenol 2-monooxygenase n=1 Tax=Diplogelasinospora grovesii TaxID=303347 RepID=A0AAN6N2X1_9PEZI|nr:phenol 2-monooxygenase [Diplogelasinospora grovesii]